MMARKNKKLDRKQLAEAIGESENAIKIIESGEVPDDAFRVINKIEQYLNITLRKSAEKPQEMNSEKYSQAEQPSTILKIDREKLDKITIADLVKIKKQKAELGQKEEPIENTQELIEVKKPGFFSKLKKWFSDDENKEKAEETEETEAKTE